MPFSGDYDGSIVTVLEQLRLTANLQGVAVLDLSEDAATAPVVYCLGDAGPNTAGLGRTLLASSPYRPCHMIAKDRRPLLTCPWVFPPARPGGLLLWREPRGRPWTEADHDLAASVAMLLRVAIGSGMGQAGIDRLTGIPNRRWFLDEADRHIDRLDLDATVGTLLLIDIDDLRRLNQSLGRVHGDRILVRLASHLRAVVRPSDLVARVGADRFAVWHDGMDHLTAAERAETLCTRRLFQDLPDDHSVTFSIGIVSRPPGSGEDIRTLLRRAPHGVAGGQGERRGRLARRPRRAAVTLPRPRTVSAARSHIRSDLQRRSAGGGRGPWPAYAIYRTPRVAGNDEKDDSRHRTCIRSLPGIQRRLTIIR